MAPGAENGLLVGLQLAADLTLFELGGMTAARLGIYDELSNPKYGWCQHFGVELHYA